MKSFVPGSHKRMCGEQARQVFVNCFDMGGAGDNGSPSNEREGKETVPSGLDK
jgi:hypothetical protein